MVDSQTNMQGRVRLPHPLHLIELLTGSRHYHCGCFVEPDDSLDSAKPTQDVDELLVLLWNLGTGFENGDVKYEITVLERPDVSR